MGRKQQFPPTIHLHKRGYSYCRVYTSGKPHDVRLGPPGSPEAKARYAELCAELSGGHKPPVLTPCAAPPNPTVDDVLAAFDRHARSSASPGELKLLRCAGRVLGRVCGTLPAAALTPGVLEDVMAAMAAGSWRTADELAALPRGREPGWCRNVVNRQAVRVRTVWRWAERRGLVPPGSWAALRTVPGLTKASRAVRHTAPRRPCTAEDLAAVCAAACPAVAAMLWLQWWTGCRPGEVRTMRTDLIDRIGDVWAYRPAADKNAWRDGHAPRLVPLGPECQRVLAPFLAAAPPGAYLFRPDPARSPHGHYTARAYGRAVARACRKAGVLMCCYQLRHAARLRITRAVNLDAARAMLGHASLSTTINYAAGQDEETARDVARKLG